jgi:hypothetical protein
LRTLESIEAFIKVFDGALWRLPPQESIANANAHELATLAAF